MPRPAWTSTRRRRRSPGREPRSARRSTPQVLGDVGGFGGLFRPDFSGYREPVLVASTDGVGTKLKIAIAAGRHDTCGADLVNHCVNDILVQGATPALLPRLRRHGEDRAGRPRAASSTGSRGVAGRTARRCWAARQPRCPASTPPGEYDVAGTIVGVVDRSKILDGSRIAAGDVRARASFDGPPHQWLHARAPGLLRDARKVVRRTRVGGASAARSADVLLAPHLSYLQGLDRRFSTPDLVHGMAHITGGGFYDNIPRVLPEGARRRDPVGCLAGAAGLRVDRAGGRGLLRGDAPRLQHGDRHGGLRGAVRSRTRRRDLEGLGATLVRHRQRERWRQPQGRRRAAAWLRGVDPLIP